MSYCICFVLGLFLFGNVYGDSTEVSLKYAARTEQRILEITKRNFLYKKCLDQYGAAIAERTAKLRQQEIALENEERQSLGRQGGNKLENVNKLTQIKTRIKSSDPKQRLIGKKQLDSLKKTWGVYDVQALQDTNLINIRKRINKNRKDIQTIIKQVTGDNAVCKNCLQSRQVKEK